MCQMHFTSLSFYLGFFVVFFWLFFFIFYMVKCSYIQKILYSLILLYFQWNCTRPIIFLLNIQSITYFWSFEEHPTSVVSHFLVHITCCGFIKWLFLGIYFWRFSGKSRVRTFVEMILFIKYFAKNCPSMNIYLS